MAKAAGDALRVELFHYGIATGSTVLVRPAESLSSFLQSRCVADTC